MVQKFRENDIAIVGLACVMPRADSPETFWSRLYGEQIVGKVSSDRVPDRWIKPDADFSSDRIRHANGCEVDDAVLTACKQRNPYVDGDESRFYFYTAEALRQIFSSETLSSKKARIDLILGCMSLETNFNEHYIAGKLESGLQDVSRKLKDMPRSEQESFASSFQNLIQQKRRKPLTGDCYSGQVLAELAERFGIRGEQFLVDAACASSLAAIDLAMKRLRLYQADMIISGGLEATLNLESFLLFSKLGALAEKKSAPFDPDSDGIIQGEGAIFFALKRIGDAIADKDEVHAVLRPIASSSDGRSASLFQPTAKAQDLLYQKVYAVDRTLDYLETHGTGTPVGDKTEAESILGFFGAQSLPVGSAKAIFGHAKGTAGAAGLLKSILILRNKEIPPSSYVQNSMFGPGTEHPYLNKEPLKVTRAPLRIGINSFGFGGTNYHLNIEELTSHFELQKSPAVPNTQLLLVSESKINSCDFSPRLLTESDFPHKLPPKIFAATDKVQLMALLAAWNCIKEIGPAWELIPSDLVNVVAACCLGLDQGLAILESLAHEELAMLLEEIKPDSGVIHLLRDARAGFPPLNEDCAVGVLNNVIAGRVCNVFDLHGKNFCLDKDMASFPVALECVENDLRLDPMQAFILVSAEETPTPNGRPERKAVTARVICTPEFAREYELRASKVLTFAREAQ